MLWYAATTTSYSMHIFCVNGFAYRNGNVLCKGGRPVWINAMATGVTGGAHFVVHDDLEG